MAYIIKEDMFDGMLNLVIEDGTFFQDYAAQWERLVISKLYGLDMYNALDGSTGMDLTAFTDVLAGVLPYLFYYDYVIEVESFQSTIGNMKAKVENAQRARQSRNHKAVKLHNIGVDHYEQSYESLRTVYSLLPAMRYFLSRQNIFAV